MAERTEVVPRLLVGGKLAPFPGQTDIPCLITGRLDTLVKSPSLQHLDVPRILSPALTETGRVRRAMMGPVPSGDLYRLSGIYRTRYPESKIGYPTHSTT